MKRPNDYKMSENRRIGKSSNSKRKNQRREPARH
jgi:hypothetical protein